MAAGPPSPLDEPAIYAGTDVQQMKEHAPFNTTFHFNILDLSAGSELSVKQIATDNHRAFEERSPTTETTNSASQDSTSSAAHPDAPTCERLHLRYQPRQVDDVAKYNAFPAATRQREVVKTATKFAGNARNIFVHYTEPVLQQRRREVLATGRTKKLFTKTAAQLWPILPQAESFFWNQKSVELRLALKQASLTAEECLADAGYRDEWFEYRRFAEVAVATYLRQEVQEEFQEVEIDRESVSEGANISGRIGTTTEQEMVCEGASSVVSNDDILDIEQTVMAIEDQTHSMMVLVSDHRDAPSLSEALVQSSIDNAATLSTTGLSFAEHVSSNDTLLDVLPERFEVEPRMIYGNFAPAFATYNEIRGFEGKKQAARLRQLADLFDATGKILFYYYAYPHVWKQLRPPDVNETVATVVHEIWRAMDMSGKCKWQMYSARVKKLLGDGNVYGLDMLQLDSLDPDVLDLHQLTVQAVQGDPES